MLSRLLSRIDSSRIDKKIDRRLRRWLDRRDQDRALRWYALYTQVHPGRRAVRFRRVDRGVLAESKQERFVYPHSLRMSTCDHFARGYAESLRRKYCLPGFVELEPEDVVIDCGAFVGGFSVAAGRHAARVFAFEPDPDNQACILENTAQLPNVTLVRGGLYSEAGTARLNLSGSGNDHSLLEPDRLPTGRTIEIDTFRLDEFTRKQGLDRIDFCKVEAEGVEPEVIRGLGDLRPRKLAVDCTDERAGESPMDEIRLLLEQMGYETRFRGVMLFAANARR